MRNDFKLRANAQNAHIVRQAVPWQQTYGRRSAAAFLVLRAIPRAVINRVLDATYRKEDVGE